MAGPRQLPVKREHTGSAPMDRVQSQASDVTVRLRACPFFAGKLVSVQFAAGVTKVVYHRLGTAAACMVIRAPSDAAVIFEDLTAAHDEDVALPLQSSADVTVDLWFYPRSSKPIDSATGQSR